MGILDERYNNFIRETQLEGMRLTGSEFSKNPEFDNYNFRELKKLLSFNIEQIATDDEAIFVHVCWMLTFKKGNKVLVKIKVCYEMAYSGSQYFDDEVAKRFIETAVKPATYPYLRQKVNRISDDAFLNIPLLPMLKLLPTNSKAKELVEE